MIIGNHCLSSDPRPNEGQKSNTVEGCCFHHRHPSILQTVLDIVPFIGEVLIFTTSLLIFTSIFTRSPPERQAGMSWMMNFGRQKIITEISIYIYVYMYIMLQYITYYKESSRYILIQTYICTWRKILSISQTQAP